MLEHIILQMETERGLDHSAAMAEMTTVSTMVRVPPDQALVSGMR